jgi:hypothetical protein
LSFSGCKPAADNLTLQIGVDTTALTAKLASAQADVRA